ncbi:MAG TPA: SdrD B-like domain-containing protein [Tepidisphaeraceae bacterium]|jgi:hypothetical protein
MKIRNIAGVEPLEDRRLFSGAQPLGINFNDEALSETHFAYAVAEAKKLGIHSVRVWVEIDSYDDRPTGWEIDPPPGAVDASGKELSSGYQNTINRLFQLKHLGFDVMAIMAPGGGLVPESPAKAEAFFAHFVNIRQTPEGTETLRDVVDTWEIGNEMEVPSYWADSRAGATVGLKSYVDKLLLPAASVLHSGPRETWEPIVSAGVSWNPEDMRTILSYLQSQGKLNAIDYAGFHPYGTFDPDNLSSNQQAANILKAKQYADSYGLKMMATEWNVRGFGNTGANDAKWARAMDYNFRNYILPNFEQSYYFCLVNNWVARGGTTSARPGGVLKHLNPPAVTPTSDSDLLGDYYASTIVPVEPFYSILNDWQNLITKPAAGTGNVISGMAFLDFNGDGTLRDGERSSKNQIVFLDIDGDGLLSEGEPQTLTSFDTGQFSLAIDPSLIGGTFSLRMLLPEGWQQSAAPAVTLTGLNQSLGYAVGVIPNFPQPTRITGSISGTLFQDLDGNGFKSSTEAALGNRVAYIDQNNNGAFDTGEYAVATKSTGVYQFRSLPAGTYTIRHIPAAGETLSPTQPYPTYALTSNQKVAGIDLGLLGAAVVPPPPLVAKATITGLLWNDSNANGTRDGAEAVTGSRVVYIDANRDGKFNTGERSVSSNSAGIYTFSNLDAGTYYVSRVFPSGFWMSNSTAGYVTVTVAAGQTASGVDIGTTNVAPPPPPPPVLPPVEPPPVIPPVEQPKFGTARVTIYNDVNRNGVQDEGDSGVAGATAYVDLDGDGQRDSNEPFASSDVSGVAVISGVTTGTYSVRLAPVAGFDSVSAPMSPLSIVADATVDAVFGIAATPALPPVDPPTVPADQPVNFPTGNSFISGYVVNDSNKDGKWTSGEKGIIGRTVWIDANNNGRIDTGEPKQLTASNGKYTFSNVPVGKFTVRQVLPDGWVSAITSRSVSVTAGTTRSGIDFTTYAGTAPTPIVTNPLPPTDSPVTSPITGTASIRGYVINDTNRNGTWNSGEFGIAGRSVWMDLNNNAQQDANETAQLTASNGSFLFQNLAAGTYRIYATLPAGWNQIAPANTGALVQTVTAGQLRSGAYIATALS